MPTFSMPFVKRLNLVFFLLALASVGCFSSSPVEKGSVLILSFSNISVDEFSDISSEQPHLEQILDESIRFTHAYSTSINDASALASVFTGLYPTENGVHNNGPSNYKDGVVSIPELLGRVHKTSFFISGGPPILRKTALSRGINEFDDVVRGGASFFLNSKELAQRAWPTIENHLGRERFLGVLYFADSLLLENPSKERKLQALEEGIAYIKTRLMKSKQWDGLTVILVGLHGSGRINGLYDDTVRIPLVIKPARKARDLAPSWKVDSFISLADLGATLAKILDLGLKKTSQYGVQEFSQALNSTSFDLPRDRTIYSESDILLSNSWGPRLFAVRSSEWVYFPIEKKIFNTYTDRLQINDLFRKDPSNRARLESLWNDARLDLGEGKNEFRPDIYSLINLGRVIFSSSSDREKKNAFREYFASGAEDEAVLRWQGHLFPETEKKSNKMKTKVLSTHDCLDLAKLLASGDWEHLSSRLSRDCRDRETAAWIQAFVSYKKKNLRDTSALYDLARAFTDKRTEQKEVQKYFWLSGGQIDWPNNLPDDAPIFEKFLVQVQGSDLPAFVKKKPNL